MRLIDANALANYANNQTVGITANEIMRFPTVDAEPVKHGRWKADVTCSKCGFIRQETRSGNPMVGIYCPNCGAKMDLKDGETK